jgi:hypothetical protein
MSQGEWVKARIKSLERVLAKLDEGIECLQTHTHPVCEAALDGEFVHAGQIGICGWTGGRP